MTDRTTGSDERLGLAFAAAAAIIYGAAYPATAIALRSFSPLGVAAIACTIAFPLVAGLAGLGWLPRPGLAAMDRPRLLRLVALSVLGGIAFISATNIAIALSGSTVTGFVAPLYAVAATVLAVPILGERLGASTVVAFVVALVGTALLAGGTPSVDSIAGLAAGLLAALSFGLYIVLSRRWSAPYRLDPTLVTLGNLFGRGPVLLVIELLRPGGALIGPVVEPAAVVAMLTIAYGSSSSANLLLLAGIRRIEASRASAALLLTPIASAVLGAIFLADHLEPVQLVGAALILAGIAVASGAIRLLRPATRASVSPGGG